MQQKPCVVKEQRNSVCCYIIVICASTTYIELRGWLTLADISNERVKV